MQQNFERPDKALLVSAGARFPMITMFIKDVTPEIFNPENDIYEYIRCKLFSF